MVTSWEGAAKSVMMAEKRPPGEIQQMSKALEEAKKIDVQTVKDLVAISYPSQSKVGGGF